jgi:hypothetical protein
VCLRRPRTPYADVCRRMLTYADVCCSPEHPRRSPPTDSPCFVLSSAHWDSVAVARVLLRLFCCCRMMLSSSRIRQLQRQVHTSAYVSIRQHTSVYVSIRQYTSAYVSIRQHQHTSAHVSTRQHTSAGRHGMMQIGVRHMYIYTLCYILCLT